LLQCALLGKYTDIQKLLIEAGGKVYRRGMGLVECMLTRSAPE
jgi:hypothetical protein